MTPAGDNGLDFTFSNGVTWTTAGSDPCDALVINRDPGAGAGILRFPSPEADLSVAGLTTDFAWLTFGDFTGTTFTDESLPEDLRSDAELGGASKG